MPNTNLRELIRLVVGHDVRAFSELCLLTRRKLLGEASRILPDLQDAEEAVQDAMMSVWSRASSYDPEYPCSPISWLCVIARRKAIDIYRRRRANFGEFDADFADSAPTPEDVTILSDKRLVMDRLIAQLDLEKRQAIRGAYVDGDRYDALALRLSIPVNTLKTRLRRALGDLQAMAAAEMVI